MILFIGFIGVRFHWRCHHDEDPSYLEQSKLKLKEQRKKISNGQSDIIKRFSMVMFLNMEKKMVSTTQIYQLKNAIGYIDETSYHNNRKTDTTNV